MRQPRLLTVVMTILMGAPGAGCCAAPAENMKPIPVSRVGYIRADAHPADTPCQSWNPSSGVAWDYGNRSIVIELEAPRWITSVVVVSDTTTPKTVKLSKDTVSVFHSQDNKQYALHDKPLDLSIEKSERPGEVWRVELSNLGFFARYIKLKQSYDGAEYGFACSDLSKCAQVFTDGSDLGAVRLEGLAMEPAQPAGALRASVRVTAEKASGLELQVQATHAETWDVVTRTLPVALDDWRAVSLTDGALKPGAWWLTVSAVYRGHVLAQRTGCVRLYAVGSETNHHVVVRDLSSVTSGGSAFGYSRPDRPGETYTAIALQQGEALTLKPDLSTLCAVYVAMENPWPDLQLVREGSRHELPATQQDWEPKSKVQELFIGYWDPASGPAVLTAKGGAARAFYLRMAPLTGAEAQLARYQPDPTANRRVIYNNDGFTELWGVKDWDKARLLQLVERYQDTDTEIFEMAAWVSGAVSFPSKSATFWDEDDPMIQDQWLRANDKLAVELYNQLEEDGIPIFPTLAARGRELGIQVWGSLRMSAYYPIREHQTVQPFNGKLWHEHPEMRIRTREGKSNYQMSYAWEAVRQERIGVLAEMAQMGCEGVMMDFCRYPYVLGYDEPLIDTFKAKYEADPRELPADDERWVSHRCEVMNEFFREVRRRVDELAAEQGRKIRISVRVPATGYRDYGFDPHTWAREKLMDIFIPHYPGLEKDFDVRPWAAMVKGTGILLYPGMTPTKTQSSTTELTDAQVKAGIKPGTVTTMSRDDYRRKAWRRYRHGADGTFLFNVWRIGITRNLLGDKEALRKWSYFEDPMNLPRDDVLLK